MVTFWVYFQNRPNRITEKPEMSCERIVQNDIKILAWAAEVMELSLNDMRKISGGDHKGISRVHFWIS